MIALAVASCCIVAVAMAQFQVPNVDLHQQTNENDSLEMRLIAPTEQRKTDHARNVLDALLEKYGKGHGHHGSPSPPRASGEYRVDDDDEHTPRFDLLDDDSAPTHGHHRTHGHGKGKGHHGKGHHGRGHHGHHPYGHGGRHPDVVHHHHHHGDHDESASSSSKESRSSSSSSSSESSSSESSSGSSSESGSGSSSEEVYRSAGRRTNKLHGEHHPMRMMDRRHAFNFARGPHSFEVSYKAVTQLCVVVALSSLALLVGFIMYTKRTASKNNVVYFPPKV